MNTGGIDDLFGNNSKPKPKNKNKDLPEAPKEEEWPEFIPTEIAHSLRRVHSELILAAVGAPNDLHGIQEGDPYSEDDNNRNYEDK